MNTLTIDGLLAGWKGMVRTILLLDTDYLFQPLQNMTFLYYIECVQILALEGPNKNQ